MEEVFKVCYQSQEAIDSWLSEGKQNPNFEIYSFSKAFTKHGNARDFLFIKDDRIDMICTAEIKTYEGELPKLWEILLI